MDGVHRREKDNPDHQQRSGLGVQTPDQTFPKTSARTWGSTRPISSGGAMVIDITGFNGKADAWMRLESSVFRAVRYVERTRQLDLEFNAGSIYRYFDFTLHQYRDFLAADSHGRYFNRYILSRFRDEILRHPRPSEDY
jgi:hypothetical protein